MGPNDISEQKAEIERLNRNRKKILANRVYADTTLMNMTKAELIEHIRILEHNWSAAEETLANSVKNSEQIFYEQKEEIERLKDENRKNLFNSNTRICKLDNENAELQKKVDELKEQRKNTQKILDELGKCETDKERYAVWVKLIKCCGVEVEL